MENQEKFNLKTPIWIGSIWCLFGIVAYFGTGHDNFDFWPILLAHIAFCIIFICSILFSYKAFALKVKIAAEEKMKSDEYERKEKWEQFQYNLNKAERDWNNYYEKLERYISKLEPKKWETTEELKKEIEALKNKLVDIENVDKNVNNKILVNLLMPDKKKQNQEKTETNKKPKAKKL